MESAPCKPQEVTADDFPLKKNFFLENTDVEYHSEEGQAISFHGTRPSLKWSVCEEPGSPKGLAVFGTRY